MKTFVVGHIDCYFNNNLVLEKIEAENWMRAVEKHSKYPYRPFPEHNEVGITPEKLIDDYKDEDWTDEEKFRQSCFDCDSMMNWLEV